VFIAFAWLISIARMIRNKSTKGKTVFFSCVVLLGYTFGIIHKCVYDLDWVLSVYILNLVLVATDTVVFRYIKNKYERKTAHGV
jgi:hypothetical protein